MRNKLQIKLLVIMLLAVGFAGTVVFGRQAGQTQNATVTGKWRFVFQTEDGTREFAATFQQDGEKVTGKWGDSADVKGTFSNGKLSLEFPVTSEEVGPGTLKLDGELAEDMLSGNWSFQDYDGTFKATRVKAG